MTTAANCVNPSCWAAHYVWWSPSGRPKLAPARRCKCATKQSSSALPSSTIPPNDCWSDGVTSAAASRQTEQLRCSPQLVVAVGQSSPSVAAAVASYTQFVSLRVFYRSVLNLTEYFGTFRTSVPLPSVIEMACTFVYLYFQYPWPLCTFTFSIQEVPIPKCTVAYRVLRGVR